MEDAPPQLKPPKAERPVIWMRPPTLKNQLFLFNEIYVVTHLPAYCGKDNFDTVLLGLGWEKVPNLECFFCASSGKVYSCP